MSAAACVKKISCNAPVPALSDAADRTIFEILVPAMEAGQVKSATGNALILERAALDEHYIKNHMAWVGRVMSALDAGEVGPAGKGSGKGGGENDG